MSYKSMLRHRCTILRQQVDLESGSPVYQWVEVATNVRCFLDLNFIRAGKDPMWTAEAGRATERSGVGFFMGNAPLKNGDWIKMTRGPQGIFQCEAAVDEAWRPTDLHHLEVGVKEIPQVLAQGQGAPLPATDTVPVPDLPKPVVDIPIPDPDDLGSL